MEVFIVVPLFIALIVALAVWARKQAEKRTNDMAAWAAGRGLSFDATRDPGMGSRFPNFSILNTGNDRYAYNIATGALGARRLLAFDYHYETETRDSKGNRTTHTHRLSAAIIRDNLPLRSLVIRPEGFFDRIGEFLGFDDIDFELAEFSRKFHVSSSDRRWAFDVLHQEAMEFLLASSSEYTLVFDAGHVIAYTQREFAPGEFDAAIAVVEGLLDRLPPSVVRELSGSR